MHNPISEAHTFTDKEEERVGQTFIRLINVSERTQAKIIDSKLVAGDVSSEFSRCSQMGFKSGERLRGLCVE